jgi:hypothetical protein
LLWEALRPATGGAVAVRLPLEMRRRLADARALSPEQVASLHARLQHIEDVRPVVTALQWAFQEVDEVSRSLGPDQRGAHRTVLQR